MNLECSFYARSADRVARDLLGCRLVRTLDNAEVLSGFIVETEAYMGPEDQASHASGGRRTPRNESMWAMPGTAYVYFTYGMHFCFNVSCLRQDHPAAVLIRAIVPEQGIETMRAHRSKKPRKHALKDKNICNGPGKLCEALAIDRTFDAIDLLQSSHLAIEQGFAVPDRLVDRTPRIGMGKVTIWKDKPLRWVTGMHPPRTGCEKMQ